MPHTRALFDDFRCPAVGLYRNEVGGYLWPVREKRHYFCIGDSTDRTRQTMLQEYEDGQFKQLVKVLDALHRGYSVSVNF